MDYKDINDYEVLYMIKENDDYAIKLLRNKYNSLIEYKLSKWKNILKKYNYHKDDIKQELELCFYEAIKSFNDSEDTLFYTYLNRVIDNYLNSHIYKYIKEDDEISLYIQKNDTENYLIDFIEDNYCDINKNLTLSMLLDFFNNFSFSLDIDQSLIFELYISGYKVNEISILTNKPINTVKSQIKRILNKLKNRMKLELSNI